MIESQPNRERAILVHLYLPSEKDREDLAEFEDLADSAGVSAVATLTATRDQPDPRFLVGSGKAEEIRQCVQQWHADVVLFNHGLTPSQERNLEEFLGCRVLDRTGVILDIFAQRARSFEGKMQVELAQLTYLSTRLVRAWTHLERQKGGIGLRGPGETQLESDRRMIANRIKVLQRRLAKIRGQRHLGRRARTRSRTPSISVVGYTNAGKSTLFNALTGARMYSADQLFATLDTTLRHLDLPDAGSAVIADTVGFIRHLPHDLVAAFRSTLEETREADLLLHVVDASCEARAERVAEVNRVLGEIGAGNVPQLLVYNKIDLLGLQPRVDRDDLGRPGKVWLSAATGAGIEALRSSLGDFLLEPMTHGWLRVPVGAGRFRSRLYEMRAVQDEHTDGEGNCWLEIKVRQRYFDELCRREALDCRLYSSFNQQNLAGVAQSP